MMSCLIWVNIVCLHSLNSKYDITGISFAGVHFVVCFLGALKVKGK